MCKERINWWWFLLVAGIIIPFIEYLMSHEIFYLGIFHDYFVHGMNPVLGKVFYFLSILIICIVFKLTSRIRNSILNRLATILFAITVLLLISPRYVFEKYEMNNAEVHRYWVSFNTAQPSSQTIFHSIVFWNIIIAVVFLLFVLMNFQLSNYKIKESSK